MMSNNLVSENNFMIYAAKHYDNPHCFHDDEFYDDLKRFKYIKRLMSKYKDSGELRERLILNHLIVLYNLFGDNTTPMLFLKLNQYHDCLKPFLLFMNRMPNMVVTSEKIILSSDIKMDKKIIQALRKDLK